MKLKVEFWFYYTREYADENGNRFQYGSDSIPYENIDTYLLDLLGSCERGVLSAATIKHDGTLYRVEKKGIYTVQLDASATVYIPHIMA